jgi:hypothetical protein
MMMLLLLLLLKLLLPSWCSAHYNFLSACRLCMWSWCEGRRGGREELGNEEGGGRTMMALGDA